MEILLVSPIFPPEIDGLTTYSRELLEKLPLEVGVKIWSDASKNCDDTKFTGNGRNEA